MIKSIFHTVDFTIDNSIDYLDLIADSSQLIIARKIDSSVYPMTDKFFRVRKNTVGIIHSIGFNIPLGLTVSRMPRLSLLETYKDGPTTERGTLVDSVLVNSVGEVALGQKFKLSDSTFQEVTMAFLYDLGISMIGLPDSMNGKVYQASFTAKIEIDERGDIS